MQEAAAFRRQKLFNTLTHYYEEIQSMSGADGRPKPKHFKRTMLDDKVVSGGGKSREAAPAAAAEDAAGNVPPPQPTPRLLPFLPHPPSSSRRKNRVPAGRVVQGSSSEYICMSVIWFNAWASA